MKEYIEREVARDLMEQALVDEWEIQYADDRLDEILAADVVDVVRCKDCGYWDREWKPNSCDGTERYCPMIDLETEPDFFCKYGDRKEVHADESIHP